MKWRNGHWRYRLWEFVGLLVIGAVLGPFAWWQLAALVIALSVITTAVAIEARDEGREEFSQYSSRTPGE